MANDMSIKLAVIEALDADPDVRAAALGVLVDAGCVTLVGDPGSDGRRRLALEAAFSVIGASVTIDALGSAKAEIEPTLLQRQHRVGPPLAAVLTRWAVDGELPVRAMVSAGRVALRGRLSCSSSVTPLIDATRAAIDLPVDANAVLAP